MKTFKKINGFTLVEMIIIIGLIGVIVSGMIILIDPATQLAKGRDSQRKSDLKTIQTALELYRADNGEYPAWSHATGGWLVPYDDRFLLNAGSDNITYLRSIPTGPTDYYCEYVYATNRVSYVIYTNLENEKDLDALKDKPVPGYTPTGYTSNNKIASWTNGTCDISESGNPTFNYWVVDP